MPSSGREVLRIHILADSDQEADQAVKLQVRDAVLEAINQDFSGDGTLEGTIACLEGEMDRIEETANEVLGRGGHALSGQGGADRDVFHHPGV